MAKATFSNLELGSTFRNALNANFTELYGDEAKAAITVADAAALAALTAADLIVGKIIYVVDSDGAGNAALKKCTQVTPSITFGVVPLPLKTSELAIVDASAPTKKATFIASAITAGQNRTITIPDANVDLTLLRDTTTSVKGVVQLSDSYNTDASTKATTEKALRDGLATKEPTVSKGNLTSAGSGALAVGSGTGAVIGAGTTLTLTLMVAAPATAASTGKTGQWAVDGTYLYLCIATDTWVRAALVTGTWT